MPRHLNGPVPVTRTMTAEEVRGDYEWETGRVIVERFPSEIDPLQCSAVLVRNHGPFIWRPNGAKALEIIADMALKTRSLNPVAFTTPQLLEKHFFRKHGPGAYYGQTVTGSRPLDVQTRYFFKVGPQGFEPWTKGL